MNLLLRSLALSLCLLPLLAETTIRDTIRVPIQGSLFNGQVIISAPDLTWNGNTYRRHTTTITVTNGAFYSALVPTTADPDGLSYRVQYVPRNGSGGWVEFWVVPDTPTELKVYQVHRASQPATGVSVGLHQLAGARGNSGRLLCSDGVIWTTCDALVNPANTPGDVLFRGTAGLEALSIGSTGHVLTVQSGRPAWLPIPPFEVPLSFGAPLLRTGNTINCPTCFLTSGVLPWGQLSGVPTTFAPAAHSHAAGDTSSGTFANARISQASVTQHQSALAIGWGQLTSVPALEVPLTFTLPLVRSGATVSCPSCTGGGGGGGPFTKSFSAATTVSMSVGEHGFANDRLIADCYDAAGARLEPEIHVNPSTYLITAYFSVAQTGSCMVTGHTFVGRTWSQAFSASTSVTVPAIAQELGASLYAWRVYGTDDELLEPDSSTLDASGNFNVYFSAATSGRLVLVAR